MANTIPKLSISYEAATRMIAAAVSIKCSVREGEVSVLQAGIIDGEVSAECQAAGE